MKCKASQIIRQSCPGYIGVEDGQISLSVKKKDQLQQSTHNADGCCVH